GVRQDQLRRAGAPDDARVAPPHRDALDRFAEMPTVAHGFRARPLAQAEDLIDHAPAARAGRRVILFVQVFERVEAVVFHLRRLHFDGLRLLRRATAFAPLRGVFGCRFVEPWAREARAALEQRADAPRHAE